MATPPKQTTLADSLLASKHLVVVLGMVPKHTKFSFSIPLILSKVQEFPKRLEFSPFEELGVFLPSHHQIRGAFSICFKRILLR
jgi:hypothetical protein